MYFYISQIYIHLIPFKLKGIWSKWHTVFIFDEPNRIPFMIIVVTVFLLLWTKLNSIHDRSDSFLLIMRKNYLMWIRRNSVLVFKIKEKNCHNDHLPVYLKGIWNHFLWVYSVVNNVRNIVQKCANWSIRQFSFCFQTK